MPEYMRRQPAGARNIRGPGEVAGNDLCTSGSQSRGPFIFPSDQRADRRVALVKQLDDGCNPLHQPVTTIGLSSGMQSASDIRSRRQINCAFARYLISPFPRRRETDAGQRLLKRPASAPYRPGRADLEPVRAPRASEQDPWVVGLCRFFVKGL